ncbi:MAG: FAD-dependent oxidoreductase, partial [Rhizobium sp.]|nr:FAD-dependent oxidoreductase [Rhizobium sp.]
GMELQYRLLSIDIGSTPSLPPGISEGISVKPIASFTDRLSQLDALVAQGRHVRIAVVGQGVAGVEVAFALRQRFAGLDSHIALVGRSAEPLPERSRHARRLVERELAAAGIAHHSAFDVVDFQNGELLARDGRRLATDEIVWTTSSGSQGLLLATGLLLDAGGFIRVDETLRSLSHPDIFAAGDVASLADPRPKAGVFAVRQGPVLAANLARSLRGETLEAYRPQRSWLVLISLPKGRAIADKWGLAISGRWVARWKDRIDRRFMQRYR